MHRPQFSLLREFAAHLRRCELSLLSLIIPGVLAAAASLLEGISVALLIPAMTALLERNLSSFAQFPRLHSLVESVFPSARQDNLVFSGVVIGAIIAAIAAKIVLGYISGVLTSYYIQHFSSQLRVAIYDRYLGFGKLFFDRNSTGKLHQVLTAYVSQVARALNTLQGCLYAMCTLAVYLVIMIQISPQLTIVVLGIFPVLHFSLRALIRRIGQTSDVHLTAYNELGRNINNALTNIPLVKAYGAEKDESGRFRNLSEQVKWLEYSIEKKSLLVTPAQELILLLFTALLVATMGYFYVQNEQEKIAGYVVYVLILRRSAGLFGIFNVINASLAGVTGALREIHDVFQDEEKFQVASGPREFVGLRDRIECRNLSFRYPDGPLALERLNISIARGESVAVVGASGAGKTTFTNVLMRFCDVEPGTVIVDGVDIREFSLRSWRAHVALVSQDTFLMNATLKENLLYGVNRDVSDEEIGVTLAQARLTEVVSQLPLNLDTEIGDRGVKLSGGERQRLSIARAMLKKSEILILDEATSALDSRTEALVQAAIADLVLGKTVVVIAHRLSTIRNVDRIVVFDRGRIIEEGRFDALVANRGEFFKYWEIQSNQ